MPSRRGRLNNMASELIKKHLEDLKSQKKLDEDFIEILLKTNEADENSDVMAEKIIKVIKKQYAENKENKS